MKEQFGIVERAAWVDMLALLAFCLVFRVCDIVALARLKPSKRCAREQAQLRASSSGPKREQKK